MNSTAPPPLPRFTPPPPSGPEPLYWHDLPATALRRVLPLGLRLQRIDGLPPPSTTTTTAKPPRRLLDRDRRAHRRLTWHDRLARNARLPSAPVPQLHLYGVPAALAGYLGVRARE